VHQKLDESSALSSCNAVQSWKTTMASSARSSLRARVLLRRWSR